MTAGTVELIITLITLALVGIIGVAMVVHVIARRRPQTLSSEPSAAPSYLPQTQNVVYESGYVRIPADEYHALMKLIDEAIPIVEAAERAKAEAKAAQPDPQAQAVDPPVPVTAPIHTIVPRKRGHTAIAGKNGDGKTTTVNTLLVNDIERKIQCVVCSTNYTAYHPEDQPIDLRPIQHLFEVAYDPAVIARCLQGACELIDVRMPLYRSGLDVGHDVVLYLGEWGAIRRTIGDDVVKWLLKILDEGRKTRVWVVMELHSGLVSRLGGDSAMREAFWTKLVGNVDDTTWRQFIGKTIAQQPVPRGWWMTDKGTTQIVRPTSADIACLVGRPAPQWKSLASLSTIPQPKPPVDDKQAGPTGPIPETPKAVENPPKAPQNGTGPVGPPQQQAVPSGTSANAGTTARTIDETIDTILDEAGQLTDEHIKHLHAKRGWSPSRIATSKGLRGRKDERLDRVYMVLGIPRPKKISDPTIVESA